MKAAILQTPGQLDLVDLVIDKPAAHEVLIRVVGSGLCHSDLHAIDAQVPNRPIVGARKPDAAATAPNPRLTYQGKPVGQFANLGAFAEQMLVHEHAVAKIDRDYPMDRAAIIGCGVCTGLGSVLKSAAVRPGSTVAVVGGGGVGLSAVQGARLAGARRIILVDIQPEKFDLARKAGATDCVDPGQGDPVQQIKDLTGGGVDYSFECLGLKATCEQSVQMLRPGGVATIIGLGGDFSVGATFLLRGERRVQGAFMGSNNFRADMPKYMDLDRQGRVAIPAYLRQFAGLGEGGSVLVHGALTHIELWNPELWGAHGAAGDASLIGARPAVALAESGA